MKTSQSEEGLAFIPAEQRLALYPLEILLRLDGRSLPTFMASVSGLSRNHFRRDRPVVGPQLIEKFQKGCHDTRAKQLERAGFQQSAISAYFALEPDGPFERFLYGLNPPQAGRALPAAQAVARRVDDLIADLARESAADSLKAYKQRVIAWTGGRNEYWTIDGSPAPEIVREAVCAADDWIAMSHAMVPHVINVIVEFLAVLDLEYTSAMFGRDLRRIPLFLALLPRPGRRFDESQSRPHQRGKQPVFITATRRLMELAYALCHRYAKGSWLELPPRREHLHRCLRMSDAAIGKRFTGERPYTERNWSLEWARMHRFFFPKPGPPVPDLTLPLIAAQQWDAMFVGRDPDSRRIRSLVSYNGEDYLKWWALLAREWASRLHEGGEDWPAWLKINAED